MKAVGKRLILYFSEIIKGILKTEIPLKKGNIVFLPNSWSEFWKHGIPLKTRNTIVLPNGQH